MRKRTKIITTLGPSTTSVNVIRNLIEAGTDVFRLNLSHAKVESIKGILDILKSESKKLNRPVAILIDLQGQKIRIKGFNKREYIKLKTNEKFILDASLNAEKGDIKKVGINYKNLYKNVIKGDELLLSDGLIKLEVTNVLNKNIYTKVIRGGTLYSYQGLNKKGGGLSLKGLTAKDQSDLKQAIKYDIVFKNYVLCLARPPVANHVFHNHVLCHARVIDQETNIPCAVGAFPVACCSYHITKLWGFWPIVVV